MCAKLQDIRKKADTQREGGLSYCAVLLCVTLALHPDFVEVALLDAQSATLRRSRWHFGKYKVNGYFFNLCLFCCFCMLLFYCRLPAPWLESPADSIAAGAMVFSSLPFLIY